MVSALLRRIINAYSKEDRYWQEYVDDQYFNTLQNTRVIAILACLVGVVLIFALDVPRLTGVSGPDEYRAYRLQFYLHLFLVAFQLIYLLFLRIRRPRGRQDVRVEHKVAIFLYCSVMLLWSAFLSLVGQLIHGDISVYIITCFIVATVVDVHPLINLTMFFVSAVVFFNLMPAYVHDPEMIKARQINATIMAFFAYVLTVLLYRIRMRLQIKNRIIRSQKDEMEEKVHTRTAALSVLNSELQKEIEDREAVQAQLLHLSRHDSLTGLWNRSYFEEELRRLDKKSEVPVGLVVLDLDGLKLINDTMGHSRGDEMLVEAARAIEASFGGAGLVARIGGDEFAVLLEGCSQTQVESICQDFISGLQQQAIQFNSLPISVSLGYAVKTDSGMSLPDVLKEADTSMYREKLHHHQSNRSAIVQTLMKALEARDFITEGHAERLQDMVSHLAVVVGLNGRSVNDLRLLAQFHDIGKVGIPDSILFKTEALTPDEREEIKRHSAIGHRIALSSPDLAHLSDWILYHHEWWDGNGYPIGLQGRDIPLECRILAILDAFDAMISDRPYRKGIEVKDALAELRKCAGTQFDPALVEEFAAIIENARMAV